MDPNVAKEIENILERGNFSYEQQLDIRDICSALISYNNETSNT